MPYLITGSNKGIYLPMELLCICLMTESNILNDYSLGKDGFVTKIKLFYRTGLKMKLDEGWRNDVHNMTQTRSLCVMASRI
jgi:hypothetical protein